VANIKKRIANLPVRPEELQKWVLEHKADLNKRLYLLYSQGVLKRPKPDLLYYIQAQNGLVKIGITRNLPSRLASLQSSSPILLRVVRTFDSKYVPQWEIFWHKLFKDFRVRGEWFNPIVLYLYDEIIKGQEYV